MPGNVPSIISGRVIYKESAWRIPVKVNGVIVDTAAEIKIIAHLVYGKMFPQPRFILSKDVNIVWGRKTMTVGALEDAVL